MQYTRSLRKNSDGTWDLGEECRRLSKNFKTPKTIRNQMLHTYLPFNNTRTRSLPIENVFTKFKLMKIPDFLLKSGQIYEGKNGKRLVYEVGCSTIIYMLVNKKGAGTYQFYIQDLMAFSYDVTVQSMAANVVKSTSPIKTIVKYEMYFLMGLVSTLSLPLLIAVVGVDATYSTIMQLEKGNAAKKLSSTLLDEHKNIEKYAPTLHRKIEEFVVAELTINLKTYPKTLGKNIVTDEKTQGQLAGVLLGKAVVSPKAFTFWTALTTVLITGVIKSATMTPNAYLENLGDRYKPLLDDLMTIDWDNQQAATQAGEKIAFLMKDSGVNLSALEATALVKEVKDNPGNIAVTLINVNKALNDFTTATKE